MIEAGHGEPAARVGVALGRQRRLCRPTLWQPQKTYGDPERSEGDEAIPGLGLRRRLAVARVGRIAWLVMTKEGLDPRIGVSSGKPSVPATSCMVGV